MTKAEWTRAYDRYAKSRFFIPVFGEFYVNTKQTFVDWAEAVDRRAYKRGFEDGQRAKAKEVKNALGIKTENDYD